MVFFLPALQYHQVLLSDLQSREGPSGREFPSYLAGQESLAWPSTL